MTAFHRQVDPGTTSYFIATQCGAEEAKAQSKPAGLSSPDLTWSKAHRSSKDCQSFFSCAVESPTYIMWTAHVEPKLGTETELSEGVGWKESAGEMELFGNHTTSQTNLESCTATRCNPSFDCDMPPGILPLITDELA